LLVIPGCDLLTTLRRGNQFKELISNQKVSTPCGAIDITISMGITMAESGANLELLLRRADAALYKAKRDGRNRVEQSIPAAAEVAAS
jgi:diguanylate cyclase (GGDEF)-like protein